MADEKGKIQFNKTPEEILEARRQRELDAQQVAARAHMAQLKSTKVPLGGAPPVTIPPLDADAVEGGGTMQQQAQILRDPTNPLSPSYDPALASMVRKAESDDGGPFSVLPPEAQQRPGFIQGVGSMYAGNQPHLKKSASPPAESKDGYKPSLSQKTRESMEALAAFQAQVQHQVESEPEEVDPEAQKRQQATAEMGKLPDKEPDDLYNELKTVLGDPDQFDALVNPKRRKLIESRLSKLDITDIIIHGEIRQDVIIVPDRLVVTYRSVSADEDLEVKRMMFGESGGDRYLMDKYTIMQLTLALVSINGDELPTHLDDKRKFSEEKFARKFEKVVRFPIQFIADLGVQYLWFDERVRRLFVGSTEELKNT
jgi:hypothetical protein